MWPVVASCSSDGTWTLRSCRPIKGFSSRPTVSRHQQLRCWRNRDSLLKSAKLHLLVLDERSIPCSLLTVPNDDPGILSWLGVVGLKRTWDQKLSSGLLITFSASSKMFLSVRQDVQPGFGWLRELGRQENRHIKPQSDRFVFSSVDCARFWTVDDSSRFRVFQFGSNVYSWVLQLLSDIAYSL